jgi:hypothetical protein
MTMTEQTDRSRDQYLIGGCETNDIRTLVYDYVAVWNESDPKERRRRIEQVWSPGGRTCFRLLDARGYDEIEKRATTSWEKWMTEAKYLFKPKSMALHHDILKFEFVMVAVETGEVEANGLSFLLFDDELRIEQDLQFNPSANDAGELLERYIGALNEADATVRRERICDLWAPDGELIAAGSISKGRAAIEEAATATYDEFGATGRPLASANLSQAHHNAARIKWRAPARVASAIDTIGDELLLFDDDDRLRFAYRFDERAELF